MYQIDQQSPPLAFIEAWHAAGSHLQEQAREGIQWLRATLQYPMAEHLSFRLGNQIIFVYLEPEGADYGNPELFLKVAYEANAVPCSMPMVKAGEHWSPRHMGWGLVHMETDNPVDPGLLVSDELIEISDWEVHDMAIQVVRTYLEKEGKQRITSQPAVDIDPSVWFDDEGKSYWVVVRGARYPATKAEIPNHIDDIKADCAELGEGGYFASVVLANADDPYSPDGEGALPLYRGHGMHVKYEGLEAV
jgi:hypothetical protein